MSNRLSEQPASSGDDILSSCSKYTISMASTNTLLSIVELGGYPNFNPLYQSKGFEIERADSLRKAVKLLKTLQPRVIVAEFNYQSDFRDRSSNLETLMATVATFPNTRVIVFFEAQQQAQLQRLLGIFNIFATLAFPIDEKLLSSTLDNALVLP